MNFSKPILFKLFFSPTVPDVGGVYLLLGPKTPNGKYVVHYAGQSNDLRRRFKEHRNKNDDYLEKNVFYFAYHVEPNALLRDSKEKKLIDQYNPPYNKQLKSSDELTELLKSIELQRKIKELEFQQLLYSLKSPS